MWILKFCLLKMTNYRLCQKERENKLYKMKSRILKSLSDMKKLVPILLFQKTKQFTRCLIARREAPNLLRPGS